MRLVVLILALLATSCERRPPAPAVPADAVRCKGILDPAFQEAAAAEIVKGFAEAPDLPAGWAPVGPARAPVVNEEPWLSATGGLAPFCASLREYDAPGSRRRVLVAAYRDEETVATAARRMIPALGPGIAPPLVSRRRIVLIDPSTPDETRAWAEAAGAALRPPSTGEMLERLAALGQAEEFEAAFASHVAAHPADAMPWAWRVRLRVVLRDDEAARAAAREGLPHVTGDARALAELSHWHGLAERHLRAAMVDVLAIDDRAVQAARASGDATLLRRALVARAPTRCELSDFDGAAADLREALALERTLDGTLARDALLRGHDLSHFHDRPPIAALIAELAPAAP